VVNSQVVCAGFNRLLSSSLDGALKESDVGALVVPDLLKSTARKWRQGSVVELGRGIIGQSLSVEIGFEMFECEGKVEDLDVCLEVKNGQGKKQNDVSYPRKDRRV
jgi:hypothetical protein